MLSDAILSHASEAGVDYDAIKGDDLAAAIKAIGEADLKGASDQERYAFLLNAYNVCTIKAVRRWLYRDGKLRSSLYNPLTRFAFFFLTPFRVAGRLHNLFTLEYLSLKRFLREDPRGHFALVCASAGCPPLREGVYHGNDLDAELDLAGQAFMRDARLDRSERVLQLPMILRWFRKDFAIIGAPHEVYMRYAPSEDAKWVKDHAPRIEFIPYSWDLNKA